MTIDHIIKQRKTEKVLASKPLVPKSKVDFRNTINELLDLAAHAPYHLICNEQHRTNTDLISTLPYRFYVLSGQTCRHTAKFIKENKIEAGKIIDMLDAADALFLVTWLPEPSANNIDGNMREVTFDGNLPNMEHIAATAAAIQNVLLGATARGISNYWSTGGKLRSAELKNHLGIPAQEILAGSIFLFPTIENDDAKVFGGKLRHVGKEKETWVKWVEQ